MWSMRRSAASASQDWSAYDEERERDPADRGYPQMIVLDNGPDVCSLECCDGQRIAARNCILSHRAIRYRTPPTRVSTAACATKCLNDMTSVLRSAASTRSLAEAIQQRAASRVAQQAHALRRSRRASQLRHQANLSMYPRHHRWNSVRRSPASLGRESERNSSEFEGVAKM